jgi:hypothetical protein
LLRLWFIVVPVHSGAPISTGQGAAINPDGANVLKTRRQNALLIAIAAIAP